MDWHVGYMDMGTVGNLDHCREAVRAIEFGEQTAEFE